MFDDARSVSAQAARTRARVDPFAVHGRARSKTGYRTMSLGGFWAGQTGLMDGHP